jgi:arginine/lysine/histidine transporter system substrate-binding protein
MATSADYPPYESHDTSGGNDAIVGFDIDVANFIAKDQGFTFHVQDTDFNGLLPMLQAKRANFVMAGMTASPDRRKNADFSEPYFVAKNTIVEKKGTGFKTAADLNGKKVAVQLGSMQEAAAKKMKGLNLVPLNKTGDMIQEVKAGRVDAAIIEDTVAKGFVKNNPELEYNTIAETESEGSSIAFPKGSPLVANFNTSLKKLKDSGELDKLVQKWFGN